MFKLPTCPPSPDPLSLSVLKLSILAEISIRPADIKSACTLIPLKSYIDHTKGASKAEEGLNSIYWTTRRNGNSTNAAHRDVYKSFLCHYPIFGLGTKSASTTIEITPTPTSLSEVVAQLAFETAQDHSFVAL